MTYGSRTNNFRSLQVSNVGSVRGMKNSEANDDANEFVLPDSKSEERDPVDRAGRGELKLALDRAKEASSKERSLIRLREQAGMSDSHNLDLTFSVLFNLANQYAANEMYTEALNTYQVITKNRMFNNAGRLKVNMGNIYFKLGQYSKAIKLYRMALDQVPNTHKRMRIKIMHNIGILFVKMGQYSDACTSFEWIMSEQPDFKTGLHLVLCYYSLGDKDRTKKGYVYLLDKLKFEIILTR